MAKQSDKKTKTNAMRVLEAHKVSYEAHFTATQPEFHSADEVAALMSADPASVFKTLVVLPESGKGRPLLVLVPANEELDLKMLGQQEAVGEKRLRMATKKEAESMTGLQIGGISPLALLDKNYRIFIANSALQHERIFVSAGQRGANLEVPTLQLIKVINAIPVNTLRGDDEEDEL